MYLQLDVRRHFVFYISKSEAAKASQEAVERSAQGSFKHSTLTPKPTRALYPKPETALNTSTGPKP